MIFKGFHKIINLPDNEDLLPELKSDMKLSHDVFGPSKQKIKVIDISELKGMGWMICSIPGPKQLNIKIVYYLRRIESLGRRYESIHNSIPKGVVIKMNLEKKMIRLEGNGCGPRSIGPWRII